MAPGAFYDANHRVVDVEHGRYGQPPAMQSKPAIFVSVAAVAGVTAMALLWGRTTSPVTAQQQFQVPTMGLRAGVRAPVAWAPRARTAMPPTRLPALNAQATNTEEVPSWMPDFMVDMMFPQKPYGWPQVSAIPWGAVRDDLKALVDEKKCAPILVRLAWHDAGTYDKVLPHPVAHLPGMPLHHHLAPIRWPS